MDETEVVQKPSYRVALWEVAQPDLHHWSGMLQSSKVLRVVEALGALGLKPGRSLQEEMACDALEQRPLGQSSVRISDPTNHHLCFQPCMVVLIV